jgi:hypothetical protein
MNYKGKTTYSLIWTTGYPHLLRCCSQSTPEEKLQADYRGPIIFVITFPYGAVIFLFWDPIFLGIRISVASEKSVSNIYNYLSF